MPGWLCAASALSSSARGLILRFAFVSTPIHEDAMRNCCNRCTEKLDQLIQTWSVISPELLDSDKNSGALVIDANRKAMWPQITVQSER